MTYTLYTIVQQGISVAGEQTRELEKAHKSKSSRASTIVSSPGKLIDYCITQVDKPKPPLRPHNLVRYD
jgi:hypothetical protein